MIEIPDIADCKVTASYNNGEVEAKGNVMTIKPSTFSLSFMRYTLAKDDRQKHFTWPQREQTTAYSLNKSVDIANYTVKATSVREGYIYIYFDNKPDLFKELQIDLTGTLTNIISDLQDDVREQKDPLSRKYYCITNKDIVWIAFSEFQWSAAHINDIRTKSELRENRMQKFDATQWAGNQNQVDAFTVDNIDAYFPLEDDDTLPNQLEDGRWTGGLMKDLMNSAKIQWWMSYYNNVKVIEEVPDEREEVFFCLHDPLGCADELAIELDDCWKEMEALIIAMQTGIDRNVVLNTIIPGDKEPEDLVDKDKLKQIEMMHKSVMLLYQTSFCSEENSEKYGDNLDKERIELLLGKDDRASLRTKIANVKEQFVILLKSEYYIQAINEYVSQVDDVKLVGKNRKIIHISNLQYRVNAKDHVYNLADENKLISDKLDVGIEYLKKEFDDQKGILFEPVDVDIKKGGDSLDRVILTWNTIASGISDFAKKYPQYLQTKIDLLNGIRIFRNGEMVLDECFDLSTINKAVRNKKAFLESGLQMMNMTEELLEDTKFIAAVSGSFISIEQVSISQKFNAAFQREGKLYDLANHLTNSLAWNRFVAKVAIVNMGSALFQFRKGFQLNLETSKNTLSAFSALAGVVETRATYKILSRKLSGEITKEIADKLMKGLPTRASAVGIWLGAGVDAMDSGLNFYRGDTDAAAMQALAAILGTVAAVGMWNGWNPLGWIALLAAGTGLSILAIFFEDDRLEELCECTQFRINKKWFGLGENVFEFKGSIEESVDFHYASGNQMTLSGFEQYADYLIFYRRLTDILFGGSLVIENKPNVISSRTVGPTTIQEHFKKELYVKVNFSMAKMFIADIDLQIYLFPDGFQSGKAQIRLTEEKGKGNIRLIAQNDMSADYFVALFDIPKKYQFLPNTSQYRTKAEIIVLCRCKDNTHTFPIDHDNKPRYVAMRDKLYKRETIAIQPNSPYTKQLNEKQEVDRKRNLVYVSVSGDHIKRDFRNKLLAPSTWE